jgi:hypothetical protein
MCGVFTEYFDYAGQFVFRNRMSDMEARSISRTFVAVYVVSACAFLLDASLIAQLPQGFRLSRPIAVELLLAAVLTGCALVLEARHYRRLAIACFALANVVALKTINIIGHLAPAYIGRNFDFIDDALMMSDRFVGFDWVAYFKWHVEHPVFAEICRLSYLMWPYMALVIIVILACYGQAERLARFLIATAISLAVVYIIAIFVPSYGAYVQHAMSHDRHPGLFVQFSDFKPAYDALRAGVVDVYADQIPEGAISFPSFHTAMDLGNVADAGALVCIGPAGSVLPRHPGAGRALCLGHDCRRCNRRRGAGGVGRRHENFHSDECRAAAGAGRCRPAIGA